MIGPEKFTHAFRESEPGRKFSGINHPPPRRIATAATPWINHGFSEVGFIALLVNLHIPSYVLYAARISGRSPCFDQRILP